MEHRNASPLNWSPVAQWCRLWQTQFELGLRMWSIWAASLPHPDARTLSAEAEAMRDPAATPPASAGQRKSRATQPGSRALR